MIFSCTKKVLDKLKKHHVIENDKEEIGIFNWYVDSINLDRKNYFLFTNSKTLFSFVVYAGTKKELINIENLFEEKLKEQIIREVGSNPKYFEQLFGKEQTKFVKTNSRSILGSMNDFKYHVNFHNQDKERVGQTYDMINHLINKMPMRTLDYAQPVNVMRNELESSIK